MLKSTFSDTLDVFAQKLPFVFCIFNSDCDIPYHIGYRLIFVIYVFHITVVKHFQML